MSHKGKKRSPVSLTAVAAGLRSLADDLSRGRLRIGAQEVAVEEPLSFKAKQKLSGDRALVVISIEMPLAELEEELPQPGAEMELHPPRGPLQSESGYGGRKLKKEIGRLWKSVARLIESKQMPDRAEIEGLLKRCEEFNLFAGKEWQANWATCTGMVQQCLATAAAHDWAAAQGLVADINRLMHDCHQKYKS